jgi:hypothetical protein
MARVVWPLLHDRPIIEVVLSPISGSQPFARQLIADTGAGTTQDPIELLLRESECRLCGRLLSYPVTLYGAFSGPVPVYTLRVQIPALNFDRHLRAAGVPASPAGFDGIASFRLLNRFTYGNFGDPSGFGLET